MKTILVVDDEHTIRLVARKLLEQEGYNVIDLEDSTKVIDAIQAHAPDLLIIDMFMPEMDGIENIIAIKAAHPTLPVLAISSNQKYLTFALKLGADSSMTKPLLGGSFIAQVDALLEN